MNPEVVLANRTISQITRSFGIDTANARFFFGPYQDAEVPFGPLKTDEIISMIPVELDTIFYPASARTPYGRPHIQESPKPIALVQRFTPLLGQHIQEGLMVHIRESDGRIYRTLLVDHSQNGQPLWKIEEHRDIDPDELDNYSEELRNKLAKLQKLG